MSDRQIRKIVQLVPELESGGVERGTLEMSRAIISAGHASYVISNGGSMVAQLEAEGAVHITLPIHKKSLSSLKQVNKLRELFQEYAFDIVHARSRVPAWLAYLAWRKMPVLSRPRFMTTFHGFHSVSPYSRIMTKGEQVIAVSESVKDHIAESYPKTDLSKVTVIHRGVKDEEYYASYIPSENSDARRLKNKAQGNFVLTLPGRITAWKGGDDFIELIHRLHTAGYKVEGWFAGGVHVKRDAFYKDLVSKVEKLNLTEQVKFIGHRSDLKDIMAVSDAVISFSTKPEAFGRVSLEALRLGVPVLGYSHGGVSEQLEKLFPQGAIALGDLDKAFALLIEWMQEAPIVPETKDNPFTLQKMQQKTLEVYNRLYASPR